MKFKNGVGFINTVRDIRRDVVYGIWQFDIVDGDNQTIRLNSSVLDSILLALGREPLKETAE